MRSLEGFVAGIRDPLTRFEDDAKKDLAAQYDINLRQLGSLMMVYTSKLEIVKHARDDLLENVKAFGDTNIRLMPYGVRLALDKSLQEIDTELIPDLDSLPHDIRLKIIYFRSEGDNIAHNSVFTEISESFKIKFDEVPIKINRRATTRHH